MSAVYLGTVAHLRDNPFVAASALEIIERGALWVGADGRLLAVGERDAILRQAPDSLPRVEYLGGWLLPGLIDAHLHFPQYYAVGAPNQGLLSWLEETVFPAELAFKDSRYAACVAEELVLRLLRGGVTCAAVFGSQFPKATEALFEAARRFGLRLIAGITLMDRQAPSELLIDPERAYRINEELILRYHACEWLYYALTPRFALACSPALLEVCSALKSRYPGVYVQTHINETREEIAAIAAAFPNVRDYLEIYEHFGLIGSRTILAHNLYPTDVELARLEALGGSVCHCPSSNLFLGSGLFSIQHHLEHRIPLALGTDLGAGLNFSLWQELKEAYKVQRLQGISLSAGELLYLATLGAAGALGLEREIGNFAPGKWADFWVLNPDRYLNERIKRCRDLEEALFVLMHLAGPAHLQASYVGGQSVVQCGENPICS